VNLPWVIYADMVATVVPLVAGAANRRRLTSARRWILGWSGLLVAANLLSAALAMQNRNNHWLNYVVTPLGAAVSLWAVSLWQRSLRATRALRLCIPLLGMSWIAIVLRWENTATFSVLAEPFAGLLVLGAAIYTLVASTATESGDLLKQDWFWVATGLALYSGAAVALPPTAYWLLDRNRSLAIKVYEVKALIEIVAFLVISKGMLCPIPAMPFGGSFSRGSSPSPSSSSASAPPW